MLSIEEFKKHLPKDENLTEEQIVKLRDDMDQMAGILFDQWLYERNKKKEV
ncbi:MAG: hypothetical protein Q7S43_02155 [bacterium]|nr:hypothetical protein [bacterium]